MCQWFHPVGLGIFVLLLTWFSQGNLQSGLPDPVRLIRTPHQGLQPQAVLSAGGILHLVYYGGDPRKGNLYYVRRNPGSPGFTKPVQVNQLKGSAIAVGTIRGAQITLGAQDRVHVVWNGGPETMPDGDHHKAPLLYTRSDAQGTSFEPERNIITHAWGLDGGSSVASDGKGNVYVAWHAAPAGNTRGEEGRTVYLARSRDQGKTFAREESVIPEPTGVCGCCGMKAYADNRGRVFLLYRAATSKQHRDQILLGSETGSESFEIMQRHPWESFTCPMSSAFLMGSDSATLAAWETQGQVYSSRIEPGTLKAGPIFSPPGQGKRKHPVVVQNGKGETLLAWTEGTGWERGGQLAWQVFDSNGRVTTQSGKVDGVPAWSMVAAVAESDGTFTIIY